MHLSYFDPASLRQLLERAGLEILEIFTMGIPVSSNLKNVFLQRKYEGPYWGDNSRDWHWLRKKVAQTRISRRGGLWSTAAAFMNMTLRRLGWGANIYAICRLPE